MQSEIDSSEQEKDKLLAKKAELKAENSELLKSIIEECAENEAGIAELKIDNGIFLLEVCYDEKPEIVIPQEYKKLRS
ncbi:hypothetical protein Glove_606g184 [Diversispora epigaea]|uniref:Uncharacterized protein n=1 Tax=Diversispora epigaea TaxID=1348612 RepID=A0A397G726_9GLOM|nr:hypothetical protein Glove_606g184 [Diversispora epigaea]